jgi:hypothetical protein
MLCIGMFKYLATGRTLIDSTNFWMTFNYKVNISLLLNVPTTKNYACTHTHTHTHTHMHARTHTPTHTYISMIQYSSFIRWTWNLSGNIGCSIELGPRSWLKHCATSRMVACSIPESIIVIFQSHNPDRITTLILNQPLTGIFFWLVNAAGTYGW